MRSAEPAQPTLAELALAVSSAPHAAILRERSVALLLVHRLSGRTSIAALAREAGLPYATIYRHLRDLRGYGALEMRSHGSAGVAAAVLAVERWTTRGKLILDNQDLVLRLARWLARRLPRWVSLDEHVANGQVGLLQAAARYDPFSGVPFTAYAHSRVRGAIVDAYSGRRYQAELEGELPEGYGDRADEASLADPLVAAGRRDALEAALGELPEEMAEAARTYLTDESLAEYGKRAGLSESGACVRRQRAIAMLREQLERRGITGVDGL